MKYLSLFLFPSLVFASCDVDEVLQTIRPGSEWTLKDKSLVWQDATTVKPTLTEIQTAMNDCQSALALRVAAKKQARLDVKNTSLTQAQRLQALLLLLDFDQ